MLSDEINILELTNGDTPLQSNIISLGASNVFSAYFSANRMSGRSLGKNISWRKIFFRRNCVVTN